MWLNQNSFDLSFTFNQHKFDGWKVTEVSTFSNKRYLWLFLIPHWIVIFIFKTVHCDNEAAIQKLMKDKLG